MFFNSIYGEDFKEKQFVEFNFFKMRFLAVNEVFVN